MISDIRGRTVILLDNNTVLGNVGEGNVGVGDTADRASGTVDGLDADTVVAVKDLGVLNGHAADNVVITSTDRADGDTVATTAGTAREGDVLNFDQ